MNTSLRAVLGSGLLWLFTAPSIVSGLELFVSPQGRDDDPGTKEQPLATLHAARDRVRQARENASTDTPIEPIQVWVREGVYELSSPFELTESDSGSSEAPVVYAAFENEKVYLRGGRTLDHWQPVSSDTSNVPERLPVEARSHVVWSDLSQWSPEELGTRSARGYDLPLLTDGLELFLNDRPLSLAKWPNRGWARVIHWDPTTNQTQFATEERLPTVSAATDLWAHGFWSHPWADRHLPITSLDSTNASFQLEQSNTLSVQKDARFRLTNLPESLDEAGEWYLDRKSSRVYYWPAEPLGNSKPVASRLETPVSLHGVSHVHLVGLTIEAAQNMGLEIAGGEHVRISRCVVRNIGCVGIHVYHGHRHTIELCEIAHTGDSAVRVEGGDRFSLTASDHLVSRNHLHHFGRTCLGDRGAVEVYGVGVHVTQNLIHEGPSAAILVRGNEHEVAYNEVHHVCQETSDTGAIYLAHNPTYRGNKIQYNHVHDLGGFDTVNVVGIYLDDFASDTLVLGNVLRRAGRAVAIGGGRDNRIENNLIVDCVAGIQVDSRGRTWAEHWFTGEPSPFVSCLQSEEIDLPLYQERYPQLATLLDDDPAVASGNQVTRNILVGPHALELHDGLTSEEVTTEENWVNDPSAISDPWTENGNPAETPEWAPTFRPIPWNLIGPSGDALPDANRPDSA